MPKAGCIYTCMFATMFWLGGIIYCIIWMVTHAGQGLSIRNHFAGSVQSLLFNGTFSDFNVPRWGHYEPFWTPSSLDMKNPDDPLIIFCKLDFQSYSQSPHLYPMFKDLLKKSKCGGANIRSARLSKVKADPDFQGKSGHYLDPSGFVFHESRVGSTLVANALASDPWAMTFSESDPLPRILACTQCTREQRIRVFREVVRLMGFSTFHRRVFFKFQSVTVTKMDVALEAFPETPFVFLFRRPAEVLMSHLDPLKGGGVGAPCLRSKGTAEVRDTVDLFRDAVISGNSSTGVVEQQQGQRRPRGGGAISDTEWCAAHLHMLCAHALEAYRKYSVAGTRRRGVVLDYSSLPGSVVSILYPLFGVSPTRVLVAKVAGESSQYSKGRGVSRQFASDSTDKNARATEAIRTFARTILLSSFTELAAAAEESARLFLPSPAVDALPSLAGLPGKDWGPLKALDPLSFQEQQSSSSSSSSLLSGFMRGFSLDYLHSRLARAMQPAAAPFGNTHASKAYERVDCPLDPPPDYPKAYKMTDLLSNWNTDSTEIPPVHYDSLCHFNYRDDTELEKAFRYRRAEVPFVVYNVPEVDAVASKWSDLSYLHNKLGMKEYRTETSETNHFMYWHKKSFRNKDGTKWEPPTKVIDERFSDWISGAVRGQNLSLEERRHHYFRVSSDMGNNWLFDELPFFKPEESLFMVEPKEQRGIHCRFGMRSIIAEAHFDGSRNMVAMLGGLRRWILTHPRECLDMYMLPMKHPSGRHSEIDWSRPDLDRYPNFRRVAGQEVILQPGDVLYVPTFWIHYIVSLNVNYQCNTRSGATEENRDVIRKCGF